MKWLFVLPTFALLVSCAPSPPVTENTPEVTESVAREFSVAVEENVQRLTAAKDCDKLQEQFDQADNNRNIALMEYIDESMKSAGCYGA